jgi:hypothetical protein
MNYREMSRLAGDPATVRASARSIRTILGDRLNNWEREFLTKLEIFDGPDPLSMRQRETLWSLRSRASRRSIVKGYRASKLIKRLWELRFDLSEDAEEFIEELHALGPDVALSDNQWRYVFALCHQTGEIERYVDFE